MRVLVTGAGGFIGRNLCQQLVERGDVVLSVFNRGEALSSLPARVAEADFVFHLAGENRPADAAAFAEVNARLTEALAQALIDELQSAGRQVPVVFASSVQAAGDSAYGTSKRAGERALAAAAEHGVPVTVFRLPNVFGKWARPDYNSVVATFCHRAVRGLPLRIDDPSTALTLVHVDDVVHAFLALLDGRPAVVDDDGFAVVAPQYAATVGELATQIEAFRDSRQTLTPGRVGAGLARALYATFVSYLPPAQFAYPLRAHDDARGRFVEMLRTPDSGQFSFFTAHPGQSRGGHYHHAKTEKFLVLHGRAWFRFRHVQSDERHELVIDAADAVAVESVPGWTHDVTNIGDSDLIVMLWANEVFDPARPDTRNFPL